MCREERDRYSLQIKVTNDPDLVCEGKTCDISASEDPTSDPSVAVVEIYVEDKNDNLPRFEQSEYYVGIPFDAKVGDLILDAQVHESSLICAIEHCERFYLPSDRGGRALQFF